MHKIKEAIKKAERHWQHDETGYVCIATFKPSNRWYQINKKQYEEYLAAQKRNHEKDK